MLIKNQKKKRSLKNNNYKSNKNIKFKNNLHKKHNSDNNDTFLNSLDLSINDNLDLQVGSLVQNYSRTFKKLNEEEVNTSKIDGNSSKVKINE